MTGLGIPKMQRGQNSLSKAFVREQNVYSFAVTQARILLACKDRKKKWRTQTGEEIFIVSFRKNFFESRRKLYRRDIEKQNISYINIPYKAIKYKNYNKKKKKKKNICQTRKNSPIQ